MEDDFPHPAIQRESRSFLDVAAVAEVVAELTVDERTVSAYAAEDDAGGPHVYLPDFDDIAVRGQVRGPLFCVSTERPALGFSTHRGLLAMHEAAAATLRSRGCAAACCTSQRAR